MSSGAGSVFGDACPLAVTPAQLRRLAPASVALLDASWHMPTSPRRPAAEFVKLRIPGARFLDLDAVASPHELGLKHMMPAPEAFAQACESFGITPESHVVIYDTHGVFSSPRALFMFRAFGHDRSSILDGGLPAWLAHGCPTESGEPAPVEKTTYPVPKLDASVVRDYAQIVSNARADPLRDSLADIVLDARSEERYLGTAPEPRPGLSSGHIPYSFSLPFTALLDTQPLSLFSASATSPAPSAPDASAPADPQPPSLPIPLAEKYTTLKTTTRMHEAVRAALGDALAEEVLAGRRGAVASCGSGMTAGVVWLALKMLGMGEQGAGKGPAIYDESWTGYAMRPESPIVKGEEKRE
ncbi:Rhodanese-like protein [Wolfiporia cocos MD-104 SS10]|uniref:Rhodanese-like protein n=1 Tax=Wolfiporia cocos (strain MD-104) TaxID=742152 RepID=A0A2H3IU03_WOLCO|nr:Rhodanese-like protein [Wolfiporia cocos MD-104 SS10]